MPSTRSTWPGTLAWTPCRRGWVRSGPCGKVAAAGRWRALHRGGAHVCMLGSDLACRA